jgi:polyisoprenoid-binding protein YceI
MNRTLIIIISLIFFIPLSKSQQVYITHTGIASFVSKAPLEVINAVSDRVEGAINLDDRSLVFTIDNKTFKGFNSTLQQDHFYENYMEVQEYPNSSFKGKIIEEVDPSSQDEQVVRVKGTLNIHGVEQERIIKGTIKFINDKLIIHADFTVPLEDHNIKIPRIVYQKIAEVIDVSVSIEMTRKSG